MNTQQAELYSRLRAFTLDAADADFPFSQRLARENGWSIEFARRAIEEYKKFAFLAVVAGHPVTPSDQVDQVWHLHLTYTRSYWEEFCPQVLQMPLHHGPTRGGVQERDKFNDWYARTIASYESFFGTPPADLWPTPHLRFGRDLNFVRLNTNQNWVIPKPELPQLQFLSKPIAIALSLSIAVLLTGCTAATLPNPLNFVGWQFLLFYTIAIAIAFGLTFCLRSRLWENATVEALHPYEVAYLAGGADRAIDVATASLLLRQHLQPVGESAQIELNTSPPDAHPLEAAVISSVVENPQRPVWVIRWQAASFGSTVIAAIEQQLQQLKLLVTTQQIRLLQLSTLPIFVVLLLGIAKISVGIHRDKPVGYLSVLCWVTAIFGWQLLHPLLRRTPNGDRYLQTLKQSQSIDADSDLNAFLLKFALQGRSALANSSLAALWKDAPLQSVSTTMDSGSSAGCGGSGCGGGGCGGCGGCGG